MTHFWTEQISFARVRHENNDVADRLAKLGVHTCILTILMHEILLCCRCICFSAMSPPMASMIRVCCIFFILFNFLLPYKKNVYGNRDCAAKKKNHEEILKKILSVEYQFVGRHRPRTE